MSQANKATSARIFKEGWPGPNTSLLRELGAADMVDHGAMDGMPPGIDGYIGTLEFFNSVFSDWTVEIHHQVAEGDLVATRLTLGSKHTGDGMGMPATGKPVVLEMMLLQRFSGGRLAEEWLNMDSGSMMQQITG